MRRYIRYPSQKEKYYTTQRTIYNGLFFTSSYILHIYSQTIPNQISCIPHKKLINTILVETHIICIDCVNLRKICTHPTIKAHHAHTNHTSVISLKGTVEKENTACQTNLIKRPTVKADSQANLGGRIYDIVLVRNPTYANNPFRNLLCSLHCKTAWITAREHILQYHTSGGIITSLK